MEQRKYYAAYEERYKTAHQNGVSWSSGESTPIVAKTLEKYRIRPESCLLEIGCGEGRDAGALLSRGYNLTATDLSPEAIAYCKARFPEYEARFEVLDVLSDRLDQRYDFIYAVAVVHMLVLDEDRAGFYRFIRDHLADRGFALICTMGDGSFEMQTDIKEAFEQVERNHESGKMTVAATSCRMVSFDTFRHELRENGLRILETGLSAALPDFDSLMYAVVSKEP